MITYLELAKELLERFKEYRIVHVPREQNEKADALAKLASATINIWPKTISMIRLRQPSIFKSKEVGAVFGERDSWITPIKEYLVNDVLPSDPLEAKRLNNWRSEARYSSRGLFYEVGRSRTIGTYNISKHDKLCEEKYPVQIRDTNTIITDNGTQFDGKKFRELCDKYGINNYYASPTHPQTNGQTEAVNKIIKHNLKAKLAAKKGSWADKLPQVLWAYRTTERGSTERRERAQIRNTAYQQRVARYYNSHVRERRFSLGDLVLKRVNPGTRDKAAGSLADKWEGPYQITGIAGYRAYRITREGLGELPRPCNAQYLKIYYP
ncbi:hypothetical protein LWI29_012954 [Acer saccharum]|uniref:Integrase catalytic domain-containing protein n=1 Tax=Acer saccharum TaxID=4024 RepID=A0AA39VBP2_ACESA|nr:hypothetical protein LWI29_012954 [Acer saccharum]